MKEQFLERIKELVSQRGGSTYDLCDHQDDQDILDNGIPISGFGAGRKLVGYAISVEEDVWCLHVVDLNDDEEEQFELKNLDQLALKMIQDKIEQLERPWTLEDQEEAIEPDYAAAERAEAERLDREEEDRNEDTTRPDYGQ